MKKVGLKRCPHSDISEEGHEENNGGFDSNGRDQLGSYGGNGESNGLVAGSSSTSSSVVSPRAQERRHAFKKLKEAKHSEVSTHTHTHVPSTVYTYTYLLYFLCFFIPSVYHLTSTHTSILKSTVLNFL